MSSFCCASGCAARTTTAAGNSVSGWLVMPGWRPPIGGGPTKNSSRPDASFGASDSKSPTIVVKRIPGRLRSTRSMSWAAISASVSQLMPNAICSVRLLRSRRPRSSFSAERQIGVDDACVAQEPVAGRRELGAARSAVDELDPELVLDAADAARQRGLGDRERLGRGADAALVRHFRELAEVLQIQVPEGVSRLVQS